jgi:hypothetical protein
MLKDVTKAQAFSRDARLQWLGPSGLRTIVSIVPVQLVLRGKEC